QEHLQTLVVIGRRRFGHVRLPRSAWRQSGRCIVADATHPTYDTGIKISTTPSDSLHVLGAADGNPATACHARQLTGPAPAPLGRGTPATGPGVIAIPSSFRQQWP